jgi:hypothetical protein
LRSSCLPLAAHHNPIIVVESLSSMLTGLSASHLSSSVLLSLVAIIGSGGGSSSGSGSGGIIAVDVTVAVSDFVIVVGTIVNTLTSLPPSSSLLSLSCSLAASWSI